MANIDVSYISLFSLCPLYFLIKPSLFHNFVLNGKKKKCFVLCVIFCLTKKKRKKKKPTKKNLKKKSMSSKAFWFAQTPVLTSDLLDMKGMATSILRFQISATGNFQE